MLERVAPTNSQGDAWWGTILASATCLRQQSSTAADERPSCIQDCVFKGGSSGDVA